MAYRGKKGLAEKVAAFLRLYGRKAQKGVEPNDRRYDRKVEPHLKQLKPEVLSALIHDGENEE